MKKLKKFKKNVKKFVKLNLSSSEDIHSLRIDVREILSLLSVDDAFYKELKRVIKLTNKIRDTDVFLEVYLASLPKKYLAKLDLKDITAFTQKYRKKEIKKLYDYLSKLEIPNAVELHNHTTAFSMSQKDALVEEPTIKELHKYRIFIKKKLYQEKNVPEPNKKKIKKLSEIKDVLGSIHDNVNGLGALRHQGIDRELFEKIEADTNKENEKLYKKFQKLDAKMRAIGMKKLYMIRHAKSSWSDMSLDDFDRLLNKRGRENAKLMGERLKERGVTPDIIISSPALRAKTTAKVIAKKIGYIKDILFKDEIYEAEPETLHRILTKIDNKHNSAFMFGHNPGFNMLAE